MRLLTLCSLMLAALAASRQGVARGSSYWRAAQQDGFTQSLYVSDEMSTSVEDDIEGALKNTTERNQPPSNETGILEALMKDTSEAGHAQGNATIVEEQTECKDKKITDDGETKNVTVTEKKVNLDKAGKNESETSVSTAVTDKGNETISVERKDNITETLPDNTTKQVIVSEKEEKLPSGEIVKKTSEESKKKPGKVERTEKITETLPDNKTKEVIVNEKEEKLPTGETIKETTVTSKNVSDKGEAKKVTGEGERENVTVTEKKVTLDKAGKNETETSVTKAVTDKGNETVSVERKENITETLPDNTTKQVIVNEKEEKVPSGEIAKETSEESKKKPKKVERTKKVTETLPDNKTKEVLVDEKEEMLPAGETIKETSVTSKNVSDKGETVEQETVIEKEVEKVACPNKTSASGMVGSIPEEGGSCNKTVVPAGQKVVTEKKVTGKDGTVTKEEKVIEKAAPSVEEKATAGKGEKINETETKITEKDGIITKEETITKRAAPSVKEKVTPVEEKLNKTVTPVVKEANLSPGEIINKTSEEKRKAPKKIEREEKITETMPDNKTKEVLVNEKEEKLSSGDTVRETSVTSKNVSDKGETVEKETVIAKEVEKIVCPFITPVSGTVGPVPEEGGKGNETVVPDGQKVVTEEKVTTKDGAVIKEGKVVEKVAPSIEEKEEKVAIIPKEETIVEKIAPLKENVTKGEVTEKVPVVEAGKVVPSVKEKIVSVPVEEGKTKTIPPITKEKVVSEKVVPVGQ